MKRKGANIITDQDIELTAYGNQNKTLSEALTDQQTEIDQLKSNVKFIYKYGGIGSGPGGGSGPTTTWKVVVTRTDTGAVIISGTTINFGGTGNYPFSVQVYGGGSSTFKVTYNWTNSKGSQTKNDIVGSAEGFNSRQSLLLDQNGTLSITILNQDTQEPIVYSIPYITTSYAFNLYYVYEDDKVPYSPPNNNIYMSDVKDKGLMAALTYSVAVDTSKSVYTYLDWEGISHTIDPEDPDVDPSKIIEGKTTKTIYLDLCKDIKSFLADNRNAKYRQFSVSVDLILMGSTEPEKIDTLYLKDNLIPSDMYLKVLTSGGSLYDEKQSEYPIDGQFNLGSSVFQLTPYFGALSTTRKYDLVVKLGSNPTDLQPVPTDITQLSDQSTQSVSIPITTSGEHYLQFTISAKSTSYTTGYYLCSKDSTSSFNWYPNNVSPSFQSFYRIYNGVQNIPGLSEQTLISMNVNSSRKTYNFTTGSPTNYYEFDQLLSLGIQYSEVNDLNTPIASFNTGTTGAIFVYQNKIVISTATSNLDITNVTGTEREIFFPMVSELSDSDSALGNYHVLSIYKRLEYREGSNYWKGIYVYIDGCLEGVFGTMTTEHIQYNSITFYPGNYFINLIENTSFPHTENAVETTWMEDNDMIGFFYSYKEHIQNFNITQREIALYDSFNTFKYDKDNFITVTDTAIRNIALNSEVPVMIVSYVDTGGGINKTYSAYNQDNFKLWMSASHGENDVIEEVPVTIQWAKGDGVSDISTITKLGETNAATFSITMQGSSTLGYRCKNWELMAPKSTDDNKTCIYSPNFDVNNSDSFLPEESFTLKADVVDSSHTNNNAMGAFINKVMTRYPDSIQAASPYNKFIKNCLVGFPILLFLHTRYKTSAEVSEADNERYYFLGVYNFNLGRKSYFNLGYKDTSKLAGIGLESGFKIYEIDNGDNNLLSGIRVGEIQGNNKHFDFSQSDSTILFNQGQNDKTYMFGDFVDGASSSYSEAMSSIQRFVQKVSKGGGYTFTQIGKEMSDDPSGNYGYDAKYSAVDIAGVPKNQVPNYRWQATRTLEGTTNKYDYEHQGLPAGQSDLKNLILVDEEDPTIIPALDYTSACEYYTTCMAFGLVDSVQKNLNIKSWNAGNTFYVAFYDMDTCLGVSNAGSKINYFAFSDYWTSAISETGKLEQTRVYRDYSPIDTGGEEEGEESTSSYFDVPSSYLFAVAKYAYLILNSRDLVMHPSNIWALWRQGSRDESNPQKGCLSNADYFMDTYYDHHLDNVPDSAFNFNYRYKYFVINQDNKNTFDDTNFPKFYGRKKAYTKDWLNGRLHILDAYFNLNGISDRMGSYTAPFADSEYVDNTNPDIYVLKDIFSSSAEGNQYANLDYDVTVKARPYAPLIVDGATESFRYIFPATAQNCIINLASAGTQYVLFGGSSLWTELSTINPFITQANKLTVNSKYFTSLTGTSGTCNSWSIKTPAIKTISLTNNNSYTGNLAFESLGESYEYPNLQTVTIDGTGIQLSINRATLTRVSALNMKSSSSLNIQNVITLQDLAVSGSMSSLSIPAWKSNVVLPTTYSSSNTTARLDCATITVTNPNKIANATLEIHNNDTLTELNVSGFEKIYVRDCPKLTRININDTGEKYLKFIDIVMPSSSSIVDLPTTFTIGNVEGVADLSQETKLETITLQRCLMTTIKLPNKDVKLNSSAFRYCDNLTYLEGNGTYQVTGSYTFADCPNFTMRQAANGAYSKLIVPSNNTNISYTFCISDTNRRGRIEKGAAQYFLQTSCLNAAAVANISYLFYNQIISYTLDDFRNEYPGKTCSLMLDKLPNCINLTRAFHGNPIDAYNRYMFSGVGINSSNKLTISEFIGEHTKNNPSSSTRAWETYGSSKYHVVYATTDFLAECIDRVGSLSLRTYNEDSLYFYFLNSDLTKLDTGELKLEDVFNPIYNGDVRKYPNYLEYLNQFEIYPGHRLNFLGWFNENWRTPISLPNVLYYGTYNNVVDGSLEGLLYPLKLRTVSLFLSNISGYSERVNMANFINWDNIDVCSNLFLSTAGYKSLGFKKYVSYEDFHMIWSKILANKSLTGLASLFENCIIVGNTGENEFTLTDDTYTGGINENITQIGWLFNNCRMASDIDSEAYVYWDISHDFLQYLPKLTWVAAMFSNTWWEHSVPFDFFHKREDSYTTGIYVPYGEGDERKPARLHTYTYKRDITNFSSCFSNIKINPDRTELRAFDPDADYNKGSVKYAYIKRFEEGVEVGDETYDQYFSNSTTKTLTNLVQPTEIQDIEYAKSAEIDYVTSTTLKLSGTHRVYNYSLSGYEGLFTAPDIFYGAKDQSSDTGLSSVFSASGLGSSDVFTGIFPKKLLKNVMKWTISNTFNNLSIVPVKFADYYEGEVNIKGYYFVPENFTTQQNLASSFNFRLFVPPVITTAEEKRYYLMLNTSIPADTSSLANSFPNSNSKSDIFGQTAGWPSYYSADSGIRFNPMASPVLISSFNKTATYSVGDYVSYTVSGIKKNYQFIRAHAAGEWNASDVREVTLLNDVVGITDGLDLSRLNRLKLDNIFNSDIMALISGSMFKNNSLNWSINYLQDTSNYAITAGYGGDTYGGVSYNLAASNWPVNNNQFLKIGGTCRVKKQCISNFSDLDTTKYTNVQFVD